MEADKEKIKAMVHWPQSKNVIELRGFLGLIRYYRRFVQGYGNLAAPLTQLLHKDAFEWNDETTSASEGLKQAMMIIPVLTSLDFSQPFVIETDASRFGLWCSLIPKFLTNSLLQSEVIPISSG